MGRTARARDIRWPWLASIASVGLVGLVGLLPGQAAAFELRDCNLTLQSFDRDGQPLDTAIGNAAGGEGGSSDAPFRVDYEGTVRYEGDTGDRVITDASWSVDVFLIPTPARGSGANEEQETSVEGEIDVGRTVPFRTSGLFYLSGQLSGEGGACRGGLWVRIGAEPDDPSGATTIPFWVALVLVVLGGLTLWAARPGLLVTTQRQGGALMAVRRHPVLGFVGGALIGLGIGLLFVTFGVAPLGPVWLIAAVLFFAVIGLIYALAMPAPRPHIG